MSRRRLLQHYLARTAHRRFDPGRHDCALWAAGWVQLATGKDLAARYRGRYDSLDQGYALLRETGYDHPIAIAAEHFTEIAPLMANAGDLAVVVPAGSNEPALGIVQGSGFVYVLRETGLGTVSLTDAARAFRL